MTVATEIYVTGMHPYDGREVEVARTPEEKQTQRSFFFWYKPEMRNTLRQTLNRLGLKDIAARLLDSKQQTVDVTPPPHITPCGMKIPSNPEHGKKPQRSAQGKSGKFFPKRRSK
jgi:hypothetical protein